MCDVHAVSFNQFAHRLNSHLSGEPGLAGCPFMSLLHFLRDCILPGQTKSFHILLDTISPCLPWMSPWFCTFHFHHCATFNLVSIILAIHMSKLSQSTFLNHQTDWFQSQQFCQFCVFSPFLTYRISFWSRLCAFHV